MLKKLIAYEKRRKREDDDAVLLLTSKSIQCSTPWGLMERGKPVRLFEIYDDIKAFSDRVSAEYIQGVFYRNEEQFSQNQGFFGVFFQAHFEEEYDVWHNNFEGLFNNDLSRLLIQQCIEAIQNELFNLLKQGKHVEVEAICDQRSVRKAVCNSHTRFEELRILLTIKPQSYLLQTQGINKQLGFIIDAQTQTLFVNKSDFQASSGVFQEVGGRRAFLLLEEKKLEIVKSDGAGEQWTSFLLDGGVVYQGSDDRKMGQGTIRYSGGEEYRGGLNENLLPQGHGQFAWPNGDKLKGEFETGLCTSGVLALENREFIGLFHHGIPSEGEIREDGKTLYNGRVCIVENVNNSEKREWLIMPDSSLPDRTQLEKQKQDQTLGTMAYIMSLFRIYKEANKTVSEGKIRPDSVFDSQCHKYEGSSRKSSETRTVDSFQRYFDLDHVVNLKDLSICLSSEENQMSCQRSLKSVSSDGTIDNRVSTDYATYTYSLKEKTGDL